MKINTILMRILTVATSIIILAAAGIGSTQAASSLTYNPDGTVVGFNLPGISPAGSPNFETMVKLRVMESSSGFQVRVKRKGKNNYLNAGSGSESALIKGGKYKLRANFDAAGNFLDGTLLIKGKVETPFGKAKGTLMTATLDSFEFSGSLLGFNTSDIVCNSVIEAWVGCTTNESVYIDLVKSGFDPTKKGFKSRGLSVATIPVPAAAWLFGSGLIALVGVARRRKL